MRSREGMERKWKGTRKKQEEVNEEKGGKGKQKRKVQEMESSRNFFLRLLSLLLLLSLPSQMSSDIDYYQVLEIPRTATKDEIKKASVQTLLSKFRKVGLLKNLDPSSSDTARRPFSAILTRILTMQLKLRSNSSSSLRPTRSFPMVGQFFRF